MIIHVFGEVQGPTSSRSLDILPKNKHRHMCVKGVISTQNSRLLISLSLFCNYGCKLYNSISAVVHI